MRFFLLSTHVKYSKQKNVRERKARYANIMLNALPATCLLEPYVMWPCSSALHKLIDFFTNHRKFSIWSKMKIFTFLKRLCKAYLLAISFVCLSVRLLVYCCCCFFSYENFLYNVLCKFRCLPRVLIFFHYLHYIITSDKCCLNAFIFFPFFLTQVLSVALH